jgi:hypothetical protein
MTQEEAAEAFEEMMTALRETLPLFAGDNIFYFMQKSHYFLHLAAGVKPDEFIARCTERSAARDERDAREDLVTAERLVMRLLPFSYSRVVKTLAHPLARAARPDFLTGRFVADAEETARARLEAAPREERVLAYDAENHDFVELTPDGRRVLQALQRAGSLGGLLAAMDPAQPASARAFEKVTAFARDLHRRGLLLPGERRTLTPHPRAARRAAPATAPTPLEDPTHA